MRGCRSNAVSIVKSRRESATDMREVRKKRVRSCRSLRKMKLSETQNFPFSAQLARDLYRFTTRCQSEKTSSRRSSEEAKRADYEK